MRCEICLKSSSSGYNVSHSKRHTKTSFVANIQKATVFKNGESKKMTLCTRCLRTQYKSATKV